MTVNLLLENEIICEKERLFVNTKSVKKRTLCFRFLQTLSYLPIFWYDATNFWAYDQIRNKVESFILNLRPVSSFMRMR